MSPCRVPGQVVQSVGELVVETFSQGRRKLSVIIGDEENVALRDQRQADAHAQPSSFGTDTLAQLTGEVVDGDVDGRAGVQAFLDQRQKALLFLSLRAEGRRAGFTGLGILVGEGAGMGSHLAIIGVAIAGSSPKIAATVIFPFLPNFFCPSPRINSMPRVARLARATHIGHEQLRAVHRIELVMLAAEIAVNGQFFHL